MKARERFDRILLSCRDRMQNEVAALIGKPFKMGEARFRQVSKEELFSGLGGKQVLANIRIDGELEGAGCLLTGIKEAIAIGGTLIMLPESELENVVAEQQYSEELQDSYGEVANIICGSIAVCFEEQYPQKIRMVRVEQEVVVPVKVDIASDQPIADVPYYCMALPMQLDGRSLGEFLVVLPAAPFGLAEQPAQAKAAADAPETPVAPGAPEGVPLEQDGIEHPVGGDAGAEAAGVLERPESGTAPSDPHQPVKAKRDIGKQKKLVDDLLKNCMARMCDEVGALLGGTVKVVPLANTAATKERFLDQAGGKQIMTRMEIRGERKGEAFLFVDVKAAVYLGGALIMLPEGELEETVRNEAFSEDASDAYGEVSNIIAGVYSTVFEEQHRTRIGFVKTSIEPVVPVKIDPDSDETFPNQAYYLSLGQLHYNNKDLGRMQLLIPADVLELEELLQAETAAAESGMASGGRAGHMAAEPASPRPAEPARLRQEAHGNTDILIVTDDDAEGGRIAGILTESGYVSRLLHFKDPVHSVLTPRLQMVLLVMKEVSEQGFGVAIKINSAGHMIPLVAAGPAWTRTLVLKAVKYGACDILITPASPDDVRDKLAVNLVRKAA